ncbi:MAG TPA: adenylate/guanylate cyclase domain-containing protein [Burkholderiales bacterium]
MPLNAFLSRLRPGLLLAKPWLFNPASITTATIGLVAALFAFSPALLEAIELNWLDLRFRARGPLAPGPAVVIAAIDEKSLDAEGRWPWRRSRIAALVDALARDGAKVIGFDVLFSEPEQDQRLELIDELEGAMDSLKITDGKLQDLIRRSRTAADQDQTLVGALKRSTTPVVLGYFFHMDEASLGYKLPPADIVGRLEAIAGSKYPLVYKAANAPDPPAPRAYAPQTNLAFFTDAAASSGYFSVASDPDGVVRWMPLVLQGGEDFFPPLAVLCVWHYLDKPAFAVRSGPYGVEGVQIGERFVPTDEAGQLLINYRGPPRTFRTYSASDILAGKLPGGTFKDKIVIVGATAIGIGDIRTTPFGPVYPGPEVHASVADNILAGDFLERPRWSKVFDLLAIVGLGLLAALVLRRSSALLGLLIVGGLFVAYVLTAHLLFVQVHLWLNMVYPLLALVATYTMLTLYRFIMEERERRRIKETFQHYVAPDIIDIMLEDPGGVHLGGHEQALSAVISDMEGFTSFSERHTPTEVIEVIGEYYAVMTEQVFAYQGTLVEYVGDELFALYGAPVAHPDHARRACASALAMREHRSALSEAWAKIGRPRIKARTGINSGTMLVGNIGSKYRFHYGAMGDAVNLTSRLEGLNKIYGTEILVSGDTAAQVAGSFLLREIDLVRVKGREQALRIHELLGAADMVLPAAHGEMLPLYASGLDAYRERRWDTALELFTRCLVLCPDDGPSQLMARRCRMYLDTPPPESWDGTFEDRRGRRAGP